MVQILQVLVILPEDRLLHLLDRQGACGNSQLLSACQKRFAAVYFCPTLGSGLQVALSQVSPIPPGFM
jgi:hypothetical protein